MDSWGSGAIAEIISQSAVSSGVIRCEDVYVYDIISERTAFMHNKYGYTACIAPADMIAAADYVFMCVRSDNAIDMAKTLKNYDFSGKVIVSISSGIPMLLYENNVEHAAVARALPNPPSRIGHGVIALAFNQLVTVAQQDDLKQLFGAMGTCLVWTRIKLMP